MAIVFEDNGDGTYDLKQDGRALEYDVEPEDFRDALRRRRLDHSDSPVYIEDETGYRERLTR